jgi:CheY-like chemotaxis protein
MKEKIVPITGKILLMDDEERIRTVTGQILEMLGFEAELAPNGQEAIEMYREAMEAGHPFTAVILDLSIQGGMGGKEAIKKLLEIDPNVRAIVSSGYLGDPNMARFREYGFRGIVSKPYRIAELKKAIDDVIGVENQ